MPAPPPSFSGKSEQGLFDLLDSDGDGQIDLTEIQAHVEKTEESESGLVELLEKLTEADTNCDGIVTREEFNQLELAQKTYPELGDMSGQLYTKDISAIDSGDLTGRLFNQLG